MDATQHSQLRRLLIQRLESLQRAGVLDLPRRRSSVRTPQAAAESTPQTLAPSPAPMDPIPLMYEEKHVPRSGSSRSPSASDHNVAPQRPFSTISAAVAPEDRCAALQSLSTQVATCRRCSELAQTRTQTVFGVGNPQARLVMLGEAPGADEDRQGEPFVGRAGQLLNKILEACTLRREDVYILNILKCRPPGNRTPLPHESANCREYLLQQLAIIRPEFICCLGAVAAQNLLETTVPIGQLRGKVHLWENTKVVATYHPAYLLRNPNAKRATWDDMKMLMRELGIALPQTE